MTTNSAALKLGLHLIQIKLGQALGGPGFNAFEGLPSDPAEEQQAELPMTNSMVRDRAAKIRPPKIVSTR